LHHPQFIFSGSVNNILRSVIGITRNFFHCR